MMQRLQRILAHSGVASRRKSEELIAAGRVTLNGQKAQIGQSADPDKDDIRIDGERIKAEKKVYIALNKPKGYVTTTEDKFAKKKVTDLVRTRERAYPVGRLDVDATGLLIMTNDGGFANSVMHPRYEVEKTYVAKLKEPLTEQQMARITEGIHIEGRRTEARVRKLTPDGLTAEITVHEGRHKIVKRIFKEAGNYVRDLERTAIGMVKLGSLKRGEYRPLALDEINSFLRKK